MNLLAVWALNYRGPAAVTTLEVLAHYRPFLSSHAGIVAGDFNSNVIWDKPGKPNGFAAVDASLRELGLASAYHTATGSPLGKEPRGTLYFLKRVEQPYHIDYIYLPQPAAGTAQVTLGQPADWLALSDHVPLIAEFAIASGAGQDEPSEPRAARRP
jgi:exodeoxyribonuclease-3